MTVGVKLDDETKARLKALGALRERSPHWLMKKAVQEFLEREEAFERDKAEDERRWQEYIATGEYISHEDMKDWLNGLADEAAQRAEKTEKADAE